MVPILGGSLGERIQTPISGKAREFHSRVGELATRLSGSEFIRLDAWALYFYSFCLICFVGASLADLNGSSIALIHSAYGLGAPEHPLIGEPKAVRVDEFAFETPLILNQVLKARPFSANDSFAGTHRVALTANAPVLHFSTLARPQFWSFFILPIDYAYAVYWQCKALFLVLGTFSLLLLLTGSSQWAAIGSLWYFFSPFTQWTYSWASALPEMVGLACMTVIFACYVTIGQRLIPLIAAGIGFAACAINFALCSYAPHLLPLLWFDIFVFAAWCVANVGRIFNTQAAYRRAIVFVAAILVIGWTGKTIYSQLHVAISIIAQTEYPGLRRFAGASFPIADLLSHFFEWSETEIRNPPGLLNICESSGFLWLAPVTLFFAGKLGLRRLQKSALIALWTFFFVIVMWLIVPIPSEYGKWTGINLTGFSRCQPALGLANIAIFAICITSWRRSSERRSWPASIPRALGVFLVMYLLLQLTNQAFGGYFAPKEVFWAVCAATLLIELFARHRTAWLAAALVLPQAYLFATVNPVERGIGVVTSSALYKVVRSHREFLQGQWLVYSDSHLASGFLASTGCAVYTGIKYLPDIDHYHLFEMDGVPVRAFNRDGILVARPLPANGHSSAAVPSPLEVIWSVSPSDPILQSMDIRYFAFDRRPSPDIDSQLLPLTTEPISGLWIYRRKL